MLSLEMDSEEGQEGGKVLPLTQVVEEGLRSGGHSTKGTGPGAHEALKVDLDILRSERPSHLPRGGAASLTHGGSFLKRLCYNKRCRG